MLPSAKNLPRKIELAWQVTRYLWRGRWNFKIFFLLFYISSILGILKFFFFKNWHWNYLFEYVAYEPRRHFQTWINSWGSNFAWFPRVNLLMLVLHRHFWKKEGNDYFFSFNIIIKSPKISIGRCDLISGGIFTWPPQKNVRNNYI